MKLPNYTEVLLKSGQVGSIVEVYPTGYLVDVSNSVANDPEIDSVIAVTDEDIAEYKMQSYWHRT